MEHLKIIDALEKGGVEADKAKIKLALLDGGFLEYLEKYNPGFMVAYENQLSKLGGDLDKLTDFIYYLFKTGRIKKPAVKYQFTGGQPTVLKVFEVIEMRNKLKR